MKKLLCLFFTPLAIFMMGMGPLNCEGAGPIISSQSEEDIDAQKFINIAEKVSDDQSFSKMLTSYQKLAPKYRTQLLVAKSVKGQNILHILLGKAINNKMVGFVEILLSENDELKQLLNERDPRFNSPFSILTQNKHVKNDTASMDKLIHQLVKYGAEVHHLSKEQLVKILEQTNTDLIEAFKIFNQLYADERKAFVYYAVKQDKKIAFEKAYQSLSDEITKRLTRTYYMQAVIDLEKLPHIQNPWAAISLNETFRISGGNGDILELAVDLARDDLDAKLSFIREIASAYSLPSVAAYNMAISIDPSKQSRDFGRRHFNYLNAPPSFNEVIDKARSSSSVEFRTWFDDYFAFGDRTVNVSRLAGEGFYTHLMNRIQDNEIKHIIAEYFAAGGMDTENLNNTVELVKLLDAVLNTDNSTLLTRAMLKANNDLLFKEVALWAYANKAKYVAILAFKNAYVAAGITKKKIMLNNLLQQALSEDDVNLIALTGIINNADNWGIKDDLLSGKTDLGAGEDKLLLAYAKITTLKSDDIGNRRIQFVKLMTSFSTLLPDPYYRQAQMMGVFQDTVILSDGLADAVLLLDLDIDMDVMTEIIRHTKESQLPRAKEAFDKFISTGGNVEELSENSLIRITSIIPNSAESEKAQKSMWKQLYIRSLAENKVIALNILLKQALAQDTASLTNLIELINKASDWGIDNDLFGDNIDLGDGLGQLPLAYAKVSANEDNIKKIIDALITQTTYSEWSSWAKDLLNDLTPYFGGDIKKTYDALKPGPQWMINILAKTSDINKDHTLIDLNLFFSLATDEEIYSLMQSESFLYNSHNLIQEEVTKNLMVTLINNGANLSHLNKWLIKAEKEQFEELYNAINVKEHLANELIMVIFYEGISPSYKMRLSIVLEKVIAESYLPKDALLKNSFIISRGDLGYKNNIVYALLESAVVQAIFEKIKKTHTISLNHVRSVLNKKLDDKDKATTWAELAGLKGLREETSDAIYDAINEYLFDSNDIKQLVTPIKAIVGNDEWDELMNKAINGPDGNKSTAKLVELLTPADRNSDHPEELPEGANYLDYTPSTISNITAISDTGLVSNGQDSNKSIANLPEPLILPDNSNTSLNDGTKNLTDNDYASLVRAIPAFTHTFPDGRQVDVRFEMTSQTTGNIFIMSQNKKLGYLKFELGYINPMFDIFEKGDRDKLATLYITMTETQSAPRGSGRLLVAYVTRLARKCNLPIVLGAAWGAGLFWVKMGFISRVPGLIIETHPYGSRGGMVERLSVDDFLERVEFAIDSNNPRSIDEMLVMPHSTIEKWASISDEDLEKLKFPEVPIEEGFLQFGANSELANSVSLKIRAYKSK